MSATGRHFEALGYSVHLTGSGHMKVSVFTLGTGVKIRRRVSRRALPGQRPGTPSKGALRSAPERAPQEQSEDFLMEENQFDLFF